MSPRAHRPQRMLGAAMLEALVALLIFSLGIVSLVGLQSRAVAYASDARQRAEATALAQHIVAQMWASDKSQIKQLYEGDSGSGSAPPLFRQWYEHIVAQKRLPNPELRIEVSGIDQARDNEVTVTVSWTPPAGQKASHVVTTRVLGTNF